MEQTRYSHVVPNSHSYGSLQNFLVEYEYRQKRTKELTKDYMLIGLRNTLKRQTEIRIVDNANADYKSNKPVFISIEKIITYIESNDYYLKKFIKIIQNTLDGGLDFKSKNTMEKQEVYNRVDGELEYQDLRWVPRREANGTPDADKPPSEWINYMEYHITQAKNGVYMLDDKEALAQIRKVVALGVRALMIHGCPERVIPTDLLVKDNED